MRPFVSRSLVAIAVVLALCSAGLAASTPRHGMPLTSHEDINTALQRIDAMLPFSSTSNSVIRLCGQQPNSTTGYAGPVVTAFFGTILTPLMGDATCDALDSGTEATADAPIDSNFPAFRVLGMRCAISSDPTSDVVITARSAAADLSPSLTCTVAGTGSGTVCWAKISGTPPVVAAGATIAIKILNAENLSAQDVSCDWDIAY